MEEVSHPQSFNGNAWFSIFFRSSGGLFGDSHNIPSLSASALKWVIVCPCVAGTGGIQMTAPEAGLTLCRPQCNANCTVAGSFQAGMWTQGEGMVCVFCDGPNSPRGRPHRCLPTQTRQLRGQTSGGIMSLFKAAHSPAHVPWEHGHWHWGQMNRLEHNTHVCVCGLALLRQATLNSGTVNARQSYINAWSYGIKLDGEWEFPLFICQYIFFIVWLIGTVFVYRKISVIAKFTYSHIMLLSPQNDH